MLMAVGFRKKPVENMIMNILKRIVGYIGISCISLVCHYCFYVFFLFSLLLH